MPFLLSSGLVSGLVDMNVVYIRLSRKGKEKCRAELCKLSRDMHINPTTYNYVYISNIVFCIQRTL